jgi:cytochrome c2
MGSAYRFWTMRAPSTAAVQAAAALLAAMLAPVSRGAESRLGMGDSHQGAAVFQQNCELCHSNGQGGRPANGQGPLLAGVMGRRAASLPEFGYTKALAQSGITWTAATLDRFLSGPSTLVPGTAMALVVSNPVDRSNLIAYLGTLRPVAPAVARIPPSRLRRVRTPGDWQNDFPGAFHRIEISTLPPPYATLSAGNSPHTVRKPTWASLKVPAGFTVQLYASGLAGPRLVRTAPNGDLFISETAHGRIRVLRAPDGAGRPAADSVFAENLQGPFGIAFHPLGPDPRWVYVATLNTVIRYPYRNGDLRARGPAETIVALLADTTGGHTTRDIVFSLDGRRLFISVGSGSNDAEGMPPKAPEEIRQWEGAHGLGAAWGAPTSWSRIRRDAHRRVPTQPESAMP